MTVRRACPQPSPPRLDLRVSRLLRAGLAVLPFMIAGAGFASAQQPAWPSEALPRPLPARDVKFPPYEMQTLPNGMQAIAVLHHEQPVVSIRMIVRAGSALDPKDKLGLAQITASLLDQGTITKTAGQIADEIDFIGGVMGASAGTDLTLANVIVMKDSFEAGLRMLSDIVRRPAFAPAEIDRQRQQILSGLRVSFEDPEFIADAVFDRLVYGFHPYGLPQTGTPQTMAAITRDDIVAFHRQYFLPNNIILAIVGDLTADEAFSGVKRVFGDWERGEVAAGKMAPPPDATRRVIVVNKPDSVQTEVRVGHIGIRRNHPDYMALNLALRILGGEGANRLHQVLRTERGLTYGAKADMATLRESGDFEAATNTRSEATGEVLRLIVDEFWKLQRDRVHERELADAKAYLTGSFPLTIETPDAIATQVLNVLFYGLPVEELETFRDRVNAVTPDDIQRVARYYLRPDRLSIVLVGNAAAFAPQLRGVGFGTFETVDMPDLDLTSVDFRRSRAAAGAAGGAGEAGTIVGVAHEFRRATAAYQPSTAGQNRPSISPAEGEKARALLDQVIAAKGGLDTLRGVRSIVAETRTDVFPPPGRNNEQPATSDTTTYLVYPNRVRVETKLPNITIVQVYDGERAWVKDPKGIHEVPERLLPEVQAGFKRDTVAVLLAAHEGRVRARILPDVKDENGRRHHALELSGSDLEPMVLYIHPETHLIAKQTYVAGAPGQPLMEELFSDYKPVSGIQVAFSAKVRRGGQPVLDRRISDIRINAPVDPALFKRPSN
jgi:zinc protease